MTLKAIMKFLAVYSLLAVLCHVEASTCKKLLALDPTAPSGVYEMYIGEQETRIEVYCEMGLNGGGYTFLNPKALAKLQNSQVQEMFTDKSSFLLRTRKCDGTQPYTILSQLAEYSTVPLFLGLNQHTGYAGPANHATLGTPYLYFGFLPVSKAANRNAQGLTANGRALRFNNCDSNPNSHITLFANFKERNPLAYFNDGPFINSLFSSPIRNPSERIMPGEYFLFTEAHWGGCGGYVQTDARMAASKCILGSAIGFR